MQKMTGSGAAHREGGRKQVIQRYPRQLKPKGPTGTWVQAEGVKRGGQTELRYSDRSRHVAWVADMSGGGLRVAGVGDIQAGGVLC